jgi:predicted nucleotidyltransferase
MSARITIDAEEIARFCRKWQLTEFALFGSVLREDFGPESDVDVLVAFSPDAPKRAFDLVDMAEELRAMFGREVEVVDRAHLRNPYRRRAILTTREVLHAA